MSRTDGEAGKPSETTGPVVRWTHVFVDRPAAELGRALGFWTAVTGTKLSEPRGDRGEFVTLLPGEGDACVKAQGVGDGVGGAHLDLSVEDVPALVEWALRLGAAVVADHDGWAVLRSPAGSCSARCRGTVNRRGRR